MFGPNQKFATTELFSQEFTKNGAYSNANTQPRNMNYEADCAEMEWGRIIDLQQVAITQPRFLQKSLTSEKGNVREELVNQANNNSRVMWQRIDRAMGDPALLDTEKIETIDAVTLADIKEHYIRTHTLHNMRFTIAGDLAKSKDEIIQKLLSWDLPAGQRLLPIKVPMHPAPLVHIYRKDLANLIFGLSIVLNREFSSQEMIALGALNHILTGTFHSRIWGKARSKGICYSMGSGGNTDISGTASWELSGQVGLENAEALFNLIVVQLEKVAASGVTDVELTGAKDFALGAHQMRGQTVGSISNWYSTNYFDYETIDLLQDSPKFILAVTNDCITRLAREFLTQGSWSFGGIGAISEDQLRGHYSQLSKLFAKR
jgi:predicted Zn-dependent peptidase